MNARALVEAISWPEHEFDYGTLPEEPSTTPEGDVTDPNRTKAYVDDKLYPVVVELLKSEGTDIASDQNTGVWEIERRGWYLYAYPFWEGLDQLQVDVFGDGFGGGHDEATSYPTPKLVLYGDPDRDAKIIRDHIDMAIDEHEAYVAQQG